MLALVVSNLYSNLLLIVAMGIAHAMLVRQCKVRPTMLCIRLVLSFADLRGMSVGGGED